MSTHHSTQRSSTGIRREAELVLARIAVRHIFDTGEVSHDPDQPPPADPTRRQPFFFRKRLIEYLADRGDVVRDGERYRHANSAATTTCPTFRPAPPT